MPLARSGIAGVLTSSQGGGGSGSPVADHMAMLVGTNTENAVRPGAFSTGQWQESLFGVWTSGAFVPGWSTHGAYVLGGGGVGTDNHFTRFLYVPARQCFAWIAGNAQQVALLRP